LLGPKTPGTDVVPTFNSVRTEFKGYEESERLLVRDAAAPSAYLDQVPAERETASLKWGIPGSRRTANPFFVLRTKAHLDCTPTGPALTPFKKELGKFKTAKDPISSRMTSRSPRY
jgi:hypothetical protein